MIAKISLNLLLVIIRSLVLKIIDHSSTIISKEFTEKNKKITLVFQVSIQVKVQRDYPDQLQPVKDKNMNQIVILIVITTDIILTTPKMKSPKQVTINRVHQYFQAK